MATAPTGDDPLTPDDAVNVLEKIIEAQNHSRFLGLKLNVPDYIVTGIHTHYTDPKERLYYVLVEFLKQVDPRPTWRAIVAALRSPAVNLPQLAMRVERGHFPDPTATCDEPPETTVPTDHSQPHEEFLTAKKPTLLSGNELSVVKNEIKGFEKTFNAMKETTIRYLVKLQFSVVMVVYTLTSISADSMDEHKVFLEEKHKTLYKCEHHRELFGCLNFYWNYLAYDLLDELVQALSQKELSFVAVTRKMEVYKEDLQQFRIRTPLKLFCQAQRKTEDDPPPGFREMVVRHNWPDTVTLEDVERFRQKYMCAFNLRKCAMMCNGIVPGSFTVTWFIPLSVIPILKKKRSLEVIRMFDISRLEIDRHCVYQTPVHRNIPSMAPPTTSDNTSSPSTTITEKSSDQPPPTEEEFPFVEQPSEDFFCPVTYGLLFQPHLTACCGKHLSQEAATRIQEEGGACPLCNEPHLTTVLNKHFFRQVNELHVFCCYKNRGCGWQGELSDSGRHVQSCPMKTTPLMTDLLKLPVYRDGGMTSGTEQDRTTHQSTPQATRPVAVPHSIPPSKQLTVQCNKKNTAPCGMERGSATTDDQFAYFTPHASNLVYRYQWSTEKWEKLPPSPHCNSGLVIIDEEPTAVGGWDGPRFTNKLFTLRQGQWVEHYPPMNTARSSPAVISTSDGKYILVIGGSVGGFVWTATIELFHVKSRRWYELTNLPRGLPQPSATICDNQLHVIGHNGTGYSCSLQALLSSDQPITSQSILNILTWTQLPRLPVKWSTAATLCGQLVTVGGMQGGSQVNPIHQLMDGQWVEIGSMCSGRWLCLVVTSSPDKMIIVGGYGARYQSLDSVEECVVM